MIKTMGKYTLMKRFHNYRWLQVFTYDFMYVDNKTVTEEDYLPSTSFIFENYNKESTIGPVSNHWIGFSYIYLKDYKLYLNFEEKKTKKIRQLSKQIFFTRTSYSLRKNGFQIWV